MIISCFPDLSKKRFKVIPKHDQADGNDHVLARFCPDKTLSVFSVSAVYTVYCYYSSGGLFERMPQDSFSR